MQIPVAVEQFFTRFSSTPLHSATGPDEFKTISAFLEKELPRALAHCAQWFVAHPLETRKALEMCRWAIDQGFQTHRMTEYIRHLLCILAVAEARRLNLHRAQHALLLAAGKDEREAEQVSLPEISLLKDMLRHGQVPSMILQTLFKSLMEGEEWKSENVQTIVCTIEDLLFTITEDEKRPGVVKALFVVGSTNQGRVRNVLVKVIHRAKDKPPEVVYSSLARENVQELLQTTARTAADVAHEFLVGQGYNEGLSGRIVEWQIVLPTGKVEEQSVSYDGESLALPLAVAIVSAYLGEPIPADVALTGAFDLLSGQEGLLFGVGGIPQKVNAALDAGIKRIYIPEINRSDLDLATEKEAERVYAEIVPVQTVAHLCKNHLSLGGLRDSSSLLSILRKTLIGVPRFFRNKDDCVPPQHRTHVFLSSILLTLMILVELLGYHWIFPETVSHFKAIGLIVSITALLLGMSIVSLVSARLFLLGRNPWGWVLSSVEMNITILIASILTCGYIPYVYDFSNLSDWPLPINVFKDLFIIWLFHTLYVTNLFHYTVGLEYLLEKRQFFTVKACLEGKNRISHPNHIIGIRWDAAVYAAAIAGFFLLVLEMVYFTNIHDTDPKALRLVISSLIRDLIFIVLGFEVITWYKIALDRIKGELEKSCASE